MHFVTYVALQLLMLMTLALGFGGVQDQGDFELLRLNELLGTVSATTIPYCF